MAYQGFLNSLHFPVQIVIKSQKIDISGYLEKLDRLRNEQPNELLANLMEDYVTNIRALVEEVNIMDKQFFVVIPYFPPVIEQKKVNLVEGLKAAFTPVPVITVTEEDFRDFTFTNAVKLWGTQNPNFFDGTVIARQAAEVLKTQQPRLLDAAK